jgi:transglutaminase-like putative cysteine protease
LTHQRLRKFAALLFFAAVLYSRPASAVDDWQPILPDELKMASEPLAPGAPAIILYRQVDRDDSTFPVHEYNYIRIKIFTEEGLKYGDVEIPFIAGAGKIYNIKARTIHPDGTIVDFDGRVFEKEIVKARGFKYLTKTFTLSDVQSGSIIEYRYTSDHTFGSSLSTHWILSEDLFTKLARFSFKRYPQVFALQTTWPNGLPEGSSVPARDGNTIRLESRNIRAFEAEDDMPPEDTMRYKVDFIYTDPTLVGDPQNFWKKVGLRWNDQVEFFLAKRKAVEEALSQIVSSNDTPETKLQKIYARVQQIRNVSYEREKTEQEQKRAKEKEIKTADDLWKQGRGDFVEINWTFLALLRAAGFDAYSVLVAPRSENFFNPKYLKASDLNANAVLVKLAGKDLYLDPGTVFTSYALLPWGETGVQALKVGQDGATWVSTPLFDSSISKISRSADLKLASDGSLEGKLTITYSGHEAAWRRSVERDEDQNQHKKFLEDEVKASIPAPAEIELTNKPDWTSSSPTLVAEFNLKVPGWVSGAGRRQLLPVGLFSAPEKHICDRPTRVHPLYFSWKFQKQDDIRIVLPPEWQARDLPKPQSTETDLVGYSLSSENDKGTLRLVRKLRSDVISLETDQYETLHRFYQAVRTGDEQQLVLEPSGTPASN